MMRESLFLCHRLPYPPNKGDKIRSYALLCHLAKRGPVHLACFVDEEFDLRYLDDVRRLAGAMWRKVSASNSDARRVMPKAFAASHSSAWSFVASRP